MDDKKLDRSLLDRLKRKWIISLGKRVKYLDHLDQNNNLCVCVGVCQCFPECCHTSF